MSLTPTADALLAFVEASPTPLHCVETAQTLLTKAGFSALSWDESWQLEAEGGYFVARDGALVALRIGQKGVDRRAGLRLVGAHTDSPNLRLKAKSRASGPRLSAAWRRGLWRCAQLQLARSRFSDWRGGWSGGWTVSCAVDWCGCDGPVLRIPSLCIHLNRDVNKEGLKLNAQQHLVPMWALGDEADGGRLAEVLAERLKIDADQIMAHELSLFDSQAPTLGGLDGDQIFSARLDNQAMCHAALSALCSAPPGEAGAVVCLYDHEEVGSTSAQGAQGALVEAVVARLARAAEPAETDSAALLANSLQISADMAHALHPNYADRHDPQHMPKINAGPVIKINANQRYASDAMGVATIKAICADRRLPHQVFVNRADLACGSTIGPLSAARLGVRTVDIGNPLLSMHSVREQGGVQDHLAMTALLEAFFSS